MRCGFHLRRERRAATTLLRWLGSISSGLALCVAFAATARAQNSPTQPIGRIEGADVTVDSGMPASVATADSPASIYVSNGSVVTVHSGKARLTLDSGGELDICGPAKFTMLTSGRDITVALNFGRLHVDLPAHAELKIFSPTIIATPIDINGGSRDVTIGLDVNDSLCVLATSGAIQLEHQFTGERLIVPQAGEFFLNGGTLVPVAGKPGSCGCAPMEQRPAPRAPARIPEFARVSPQPAIAPPNPITPAAAPAPPPPAQSAAAQTSVENGSLMVIPVNPNDERPLAQPDDQPAGEAPKIGESLRGEVTPALAFMASAPPPPDNQEPQMMLLVTETSESPDWQFEGQVQPPEFADAMRHALGEGRAAIQTNAAPPRKKHGFWAALKSFFFG